MLVIVGPLDSCSMINLSELSAQLFPLALFCSFFLVKWFSLMLLLRFKNLLYILDNSSLFDLLFANISGQSKSEREDLKLNEVLLISHFMDQAKYNPKTHYLRQSL